ncbi:MAG: hypothetical protein JWO02_444 [Solirubrobacterales bacterium]|nr:hypothetical protein [Solirubrobacterales bacterium]
MSSRTRRAAAAALISVLAGGVPVSAVSAETDHPPSAAAGPAYAPADVPAGTSAGVPAGALAGVPAGASADVPAGVPADGTVWLLAPSGDQVGGGQCGKVTFPVTLPIVISCGPVTVNITLNTITTTTTTTTVGAPITSAGGPITTTAVTNPAAVATPAPATPLGRKPSRKKKAKATGPKRGVTVKQFKHWGPITTMVIAPKRGTRTITISVPVRSGPHLSR